MSRSAVHQERLAHPQAHSKDRHLTGRIDWLFTLGLVSFGIASLIATPVLLLSGL
ncbi:MAG: hypothetical protein WCA07_17125 [Gloeobacterales cyanobacterium]